MSKSDTSPASPQPAPEAHPMTEREHRLRDGIRASFDRGFVWNSFDVGDLLFLVERFDRVEARCRELESAHSPAAPQEGTTPPEIDVAGIELYRATLTLGAKNRGTAFTPEQSRDLITLLDRLASSALTSSQPDSSLRAAEPEITADLLTLEKAAVRFELLAGRFRGCERAKHHVLSIEDCEAFEVETREAFMRISAELRAGASSPTVTPPQTPTPEAAAMLTLIADYFEHGNIQGLIDAGFEYKTDIAKPLRALAASPPVTEEAPNEDTARLDWLDQNGYVDLIYADGLLRETIDAARSTPTEEKTR